jgi:hypothetical protein
MLAAWQLWWAASRAQLHNLISSMRVSSARFAEDGYFPDWKSTTWGIYSFFSPFFNAFLKQIQDQGELKKVKVQPNVQEVYTVYT